VSLLSEVGVPDPEKRLRNYPHQLSGGMRQRVMIAVALSCEPRLLIADEPTTALDVTVQRQILDLLRGVQRDRDMSMILISHDLSVVAGHTDRVAVMYAGRVVETGATRQVFAHPTHRYTSALLGATPSLTHQRHVRLQVIEGGLPDLADPPAGCGFAPRCAVASDDCSAERPVLVPVGPELDHAAACLHPMETVSGGTGGR
jgi:peptide/nickel transport system ATP-binding protein